MLLSTKTILPECLIYVLCFLLCDFLCSPFSLTWAKIFLMHSHIIDV